MQGMDVPEELGNPKIAGPGTYWSYNAGTKTVTVSGEGAYAGAAKDEQLGSGLYHTVILGANVSRLLRECVIPGASALVLLRLCGKAASKMPLVAAVPLAVYTVAHFLPPAATVAAVAFVAFSVVMLWFAARMIRAYNDARVKK